LFISAKELWYNTNDADNYNSIKEHTWHVGGTYQRGSLGSHGDCMREEDKPDIVGLIIIYACTYGPPHTWINSKLFIICSCMSIVHISKLGILLAWNPI